jgi:hypothetical protein
MNLRLGLLVAAIICAFVTVLIGAGWWDDQLAHVWAWAGGSLLLLEASFLPPAP